MRPLFRRQLLAVLFSALFAGGCGSSDTADTPSNTADGESLTIYTGRDKDEVAHVVNLFTTQHPQYKDNVATVILPAQEALTRLRAEQSNPQAGFTCVCHSVSLQTTS